ncbi:PD-(D/E)XK nuclease-like domain-containing protein [Sulfurimonas sp.]|uniref:PD-(D/E)XK nuclease-like domain-containing protein n=1 Tax=Sulfurimonas sp. TaxID=2022749 RepID=UPI0035625B3B
MSKIEKYKGCMKVSDEEYFKIPALSNSDFRLLKESVLHYENKDLFQLSGSSLELGSAVHKLVLEPDTFNEDFVIEDFKGAELNKNSKAYKEAKAAWEDGVKGRKILSKDLFEQVTLMAKNVKAIAGGLLQGGIAENAFISEFDGMPVKCKADYYRQDAGVVIDLKTTKSIKDFKKSILEYGYGTQSAFYLDVINKAGYKADRFIFILVETSAPYMVSVQEMSLESIEEGRAIYSELLQTWKNYKNDGVVNVVKTTGYPEWYLEQRRGA